jgi:integrase
MRQKGSVTPGVLYPRGKAGIWYFKATDQGGKRIQRSTGTSDRKEAEEFQKRWVEQHGRNRPIYAKPLTFREVVVPYQDPATNPRYRDAKIQESNYTDEHAANFARHAKKLEEILDKRLPGLMDEQVSDITKRDMKDVAAAIVAERGKCRTSQQVFAVCKTILRQAVSDDLILTSPGAGIPNIGYTEKKLIAIDEEMLAWMINQRQLFPSLEFWAYVTVVAVTGMRRGEAIAMSRDRLTGNLYTIDQQIKANSQYISKPKGGLSRTIPLPRIALAALEEIPPTDGPFYFPLSRNWVTSQFGLLKAALKAADPANRSIWSVMTLHTLRRSLNTNLLVHGMSDHLVAEYMSWKHQSQNQDASIIMQRRYLKLNESKLQPVADMIDRLYAYTENQDERVIPFKV